MSKRVLLLSLLVLLTALPNVFAGGDGGPLLMVYDMDFASVNDYIADYGLPPINPPVFMWGGAGTSWLNDDFGMGVVIAGGHRTSYKDNQMARFFSVFALLQFKNVISRKEHSKTYFIYGPGIVNLYLGLSGTSGGEFIVYNMLFYGGLGWELDLSNTTSLEFRIGYNIVPQKNWDKFSGDLPLPGSFSGKGSSASLSLFFGG